MNETEIKDNDLNKLLVFYLKTPTISKKSNPLQNWRENYKTLYPFSELAKKLFSFPASSVASERLFSSTSQIVTKRRNLIHNKKIEQIIFLRENYRLI